MMKAVKQDAKALKYAGRLREDRDVVLEAVRTMGWDTESEEAGSRGRQCVLITRDKRVVGYDSIYAKLADLFSDCALPPMMMKALFPHRDPIGAEQERVVITHMISRSDLIGKRGVIVEAVKDGRAKVLVTTTGSPRETHNIKLENLSLLDEVRWSGVGGWGYENGMLHPPP